MAKKKKKSYGFLIFMLLYIALFIGAGVWGLQRFWDFIAAYEVSRPQKPIDAYMEQLTPERICDLSGDLIAQVDHSIQSEEECRRIITEAVSGSITYARRLKDCTEDKNVYMLMCGGKTIGSFVTTAQPADQYGFRIWEVTEESFDLSYLIGDSITVTAPQSCTVSINGAPLDSSYLTGETATYPLLESYYDDYSDLPLIVTYHAGPFLGQPEATITDPAGNVVVIDENTDWNRFLCTCTRDETNQLNSFLDDFIESYIRFTSSKDDRYARYHEVVRYMVPDSKLAKRMADALGGLMYNHIRSAELQSITVHYLVPLDDTHYLCDVTYQTEVDKGEGAYMETNNMRLILVMTQTGLKAESMTSY